MQNVALAEQLSFVVTQRGINEATILAQAVSKGIQLIYQESVIEAYLLGSISREQAMETLSPATIEEVEYQREALKRDVEWGLKDD